MTFSVNAIFREQILYFILDKESDYIGSANFNHIVQALKSQGPGPEAGLDKTVPEESRNAASKAVNSGQVG